MSAAANGPSLVGKVPEFDCRNTKEALSDTEISCPLVDAELMENYLVYLVRSGFLNSPPAAEEPRLVDANVEVLTGEILRQGWRLYIDPDCTTRIVAGHAKEWIG